jgi:hypothetical protein
MHKNLYNIIHDKFKEPLKKCKDEKEEKQLKKMEREISEHI